MFSGDSPDDWEVSPSNLAWVEELYYAYRRDPASVDEAWRREFERMEGGPPPPVSGQYEPPSNGHPTTARDKGQEAQGNGHGNGHLVREAVVAVAEGEV